MRKPRLFQNYPKAMDRWILAYRLANRPITVYGPHTLEPFVPRSKDLEMPHAVKIAVFSTMLAALGGFSDEAMARGGKYPLTRCGPDLAYLCPIHGYFDLTPFHYNLAIHPGCIRTVNVETPAGIERRRALVCGAPDRPMVYW